VPWTAGVAAVAAFALLGVCILRPALSMPRLAGLLVGGALLLNTAALLLPGGGLEPFARRLLACGHTEFFVRASLHPHLLSSLTDYEALVADGNPAFYSRQKGPANLATHVAVVKLAGATPVRRSLDRSVDEPGFHRRMHEALARGKARRFAGFDERTSLDVTRAFLLMPVLAVLACALLPLPMLLLATSLFPRPAAVTAAATSVLIPPILLEHVQLDGSVFPLLFVTGFAVFCAARARRHLAWIAAAAGLAALYAWFTLAAAVLVAICVAALLLDAVASVRRGSVTQETRGDAALPSTRWSLQALGAYLLGLAGTLGVLRLAFGFAVLDRYRAARGIQTTIRDVNVDSHEAAWRWILLNSLEFGASIGPLFCVLAAVGAALGVRALLRCGASTADTTSVAVVGVLLALLVVGANSEVYRLWAFLGLALGVPVFRAAQPLFRLERRNGRVVYTALCWVWALAAAARFGHV